MCQRGGESTNSTYVGHYEKNDDEKREQSQEKTTTDEQKETSTTTTTTENENKEVKNPENSSSNNTETEQKQNSTTTTNNNGTQTDTTADSKKADDKDSKQSSEEKSQKATEEREKEKPVIIEKTINFFNNIGSNIANSTFGQKAGESFKAIAAGTKNFVEGAKESYKESAQKAYDNFMNSQRGQDAREFIGMIKAEYKEAMDKPADTSTSIANKDKADKEPPKTDAKPPAMRILTPEQISATAAAMKISTELRDSKFEFTAPFQTEKPTDTEKTDSTENSSTDKDTSETSSGSGILLPTEVGGGTQKTDPQLNVTTILTAKAKEDQKQSDEKYSGLSANFFQDGRTLSPTEARIEVVSKIDSLSKTDHSNNKIDSYTMVKYVTGKPDIYKAAIEKITQLNPNFDVSSLRGVNQEDIKRGMIYGSEQKPILAKDLDSKPESTYKMTAIIATCAVAVLTSAKGMSECQEIKAERAAIGLPADSTTLTPKEIEIYREFGIISSEQAEEFKQEYDSQYSEITNTISTYEDSLTSQYNEGHVDSPEMFNAMCSGDPFNNDATPDSTIQLPAEAFTSLEDLHEQYQNGEITGPEYISQLETMSTYDSIASTTLSIKNDIESYQSIVNVGIEAGVLEEQDGKYVTTTELVAQQDNYAIACPAGTEFPMDTGGAERLEMIREIFTEFNSGNITSSDVTDRIENIPESRFEHEQYTIDDLISFMQAFVEN